LLCFKQIGKQDHYHKKEWVWMHIVVFSKFLIKLIICIDCSYLSIIVCMHFHHLIIVNMKTTIILTIFHLTAHRSFNILIPLVFHPLNLVACTFRIWCWTCTLKAVFICYFACFSIFEKYNSFALILFHSSNIFLRSSRANLSL